LKHGGYNVKARVLVIEDEIDLAKIVGMYLEREGIECRLCTSAEEAMGILGAEHYDLLLLDLNLPGMDGFEFLQALRRDNNVPVIVVSARESDEDIVLGLGLGADEFVVKPVAPRNLVARVRALLRRVRQTRPSKQVYRFGDYNLDPEAYVLTRLQQRILLSAKEFDVLLFLVTASGKVFSVKEIYEAVWGRGYGDLTIVGVYVQRLRKKLEVDSQNPVFLETVTGKGYRFNAELLDRSSQWA